MLIPLTVHTRQINCSFAVLFQSRAFTWNDNPDRSLGASAGLPLSAVGVVVADPQDYSAAIREIVHWYPHYRTTATDFSLGWSRYHVQKSLRRSCRKLLAAIPGSNGSMRRGPPRTVGCGHP